MGGRNQAGAGRGECRDVLGGVSGCADQPDRGRQLEAVGVAVLPDVDESELSAREIADQLGHAKVSITQDNYLGRRLTSRRTAEALQVAVGRTFTDR
ncbi:hypothetical protein GCM10009610_07070 [Pseudonocardia xinjiangensis]